MNQSSVRTRSTKRMWRTAFGIFLVQCFLLISYAEGFSALAFRERSFILPPGGGPCPCMGRPHTKYQSLRFFKANGKSDDFLDDDMTESFYIRQAMYSGVCDCCRLFCSSSCHAVTNAPTLTYKLHHYNHCRPR